MTSAAEMLGSASPPFSVERLASQASINAFSGAVMSADYCGQITVVLGKAQGSF
tara:strand:+ start:4006 stop:4167 length:162 start_codon:yes stop_codon:yes gene_type:complete